MGTLGRRSFMKQVAQAATALSLTPAIAVTIANEKRPEYHITERELKRIMKNMEPPKDDFVVWTGLKGKEEFEREFERVLGEQISRFGKA